VLRAATGILHTVKCNDPFCHRSSVEMPLKFSQPAAPWYQKAVVYELHVRGFHDSDGSGTGDFRGLISKLDYIQSLGVTAIWLLPFCPSPWRDDGYDISDFTGIHPAYGSLEDFQAFLKECKQRDLRVITELVLNHTSDQHPWFERARRSAPGSRYRNFYVWSDTPDKYGGVRIIFKDFETSNWAWDPVAQAWYWHRFYSHQPDLNFDSADVRQAVFDTVDFWFGLGVDGLRLDAVPYLFEREGTTCENLPETHEFLKQLRAYVDSRYEQRMLLAEANQWPEDAVAYFGDGDECHMAFNFPLMPRMFMAIRTEDSFPISNIIQQTPVPPQGCHWATFLRNHDELTLEMVCEEERDFMYRAYAHDPEMRINVGIRRRLAPLLTNDGRLIRLMNALLFSLPGTPVIYYGDEIGMGEDLTLGDRNGVRTPMQWDAGKNAGFSPADGYLLYLPVVSQGEYSYEIVNVEAELKNRNSLLWWMRHSMALRRESQALTEGGIEFLTHANRHVLAFLRTSPDEVVLVISNLSRYAQPVQLALGGYAGRIPVEAFGRVEFPAIGRDSYQLSLPPYGFYWFHLQRPAVEEDNGEGIPESDEVVESFDRIFQFENRTELARILTPHLKSGNAGRVRRATHADVIDLATFENRSCIAVVRVQFTAGEPELQFLPLTLIELTTGGDTADGLRRVITILRSASRHQAALYIDAASGPVSDAMLRLISEQTEMPTQAGSLRGTGFGALTPAPGPATVCLLPDSPTDHQRNASALLSGVYSLKLYRRLEAGENPEIETARFLFEEAGFNHLPPVFGKVQYISDEDVVFDAGVLQAFVENQTDLWQLTLEELALYLERASTADRSKMEDPVDLIQTFLELTRLLANRTGLMHLALAGPPDSEFAPEPFDPFYLRGESYSMTTRAALVREALEQRASGLESDIGPDLALALDSLRSADAVFRRLTEFTALGQRIRLHGDFHLGQVLHTGDDVVFIDFEGDNSRPLFERRIKASPLVDTAGMLHSFHYAAESADFDKVAAPFAWRGREGERKEWTIAWYRTLRSIFTSEYRKTIAGHGLAPDEEHQFERLLEIYLIAAAVYQVGYELEHRPAWIAVALRSLIEITSATDLAS
jgi:maltose alpha-D-glucosyltransferase / alpha-amylase